MARIAVYFLVGRIKNSVRISIAITELDSIDGLLNKVSTNNFVCKRYSFGVTRKRISQVFVKKLV